MQISELTNIRGFKAFVTLVTLFISGYVTAQLISAKLTLIKIPGIPFDLIFPMGFIAYSIVFLLPLGIVLYNRLEDATATLIALLLIGGFTGGLIGIFVPASGLKLCWILFVLGIATLLYRLIKS